MNIIEEIKLLLHQNNIIKAKQSIIDYEHTINDIKSFYNKKISLNNLKIIKQLYQEYENIQPQALIIKEKENIKINIHYSQSNIIRIYNNNISDNVDSDGMSDSYSDGIGKYVSDSKCVSDNKSNETHISDNNTNNTNTPKHTNTTTNNNHTTNNNNNNITLKHIIHGNEIQIDNCYDISIKCIADESLVIRNTKNSIIICKAKQIRLEECINIEIIAYTDSGIFIEESNNIIIKEYLEEGLDRNKNQWENVNDFSMPGSMVNYTLKYTTE
ncbi:hypothetical protein SLOPH_1769 [Spraguea lophii 42_110]|uniref:C-CAP/cofactor C-like domain-containing protein n=1 Tax=Spraguea lophii (strain 42_110) TaxID=1358809 RepID=S7XIV9_SPRLO|nr:hypothetical protein SLOPH_1769 [Spraguea lophii 42_110]